MSLAFANSMEMKFQKKSLAWLTLKCPKAFPSGCSSGQCFTINIYKIERPKGEAVLQ